MKELRLWLSQNLRMLTKTAGALLLLSLVISGCVSKQYFIPAFDKSEYQELKGGQSFTAPSEFLCVSRQYAKSIMGVDGVEPSKILKGK